MLQCEPYTVTWKPYFQMHVSGERRSVGYWIDLLNYQLLKQFVCLVTWLMKQNFLTLVVGGILWYQVDILKQQNSYGVLYCLDHITEPRHSTLILDISSVWNYEKFGFLYSTVCGSANLWFKTSVGERQLSSEVQESTAISKTWRRWCLVLWRRCWGLELIEKRVQTVL